jgi:galactokinase
MSDFFSKDEDVIKSSAPGRMDVMGGIADYSGSLLLQMPIKQTTTVSIQK